MLYKITHAAPLKALDALGSHIFQQRTGREGYILYLSIGDPMLFGYIGEEEGKTLRTLPVRCVQQDAPHSVVVTTTNAVYRLEGIGVYTEEALLWDEG